MSQKIFIAYLRIFIVELGEPFYANKARKRKKLLVVMSVIHSSQKRRL